MGLVITGNVTGGMLAGAMLRAQAVIPGNLNQKQLAGVGFFKGYLGDSNSVRSADWQKATRLSPEQIVARASLNNGWLEEAGRHIEAATDPIIRAGLLGQIMEPHLQIPATLFGAEIREVIRDSLQVKAEEISHLLEPKFPKIELEMCKIPAGEFPMGSQKHANERFTDGERHVVTLSEFLIGKYEITNAQYEIFMRLTGAESPAYWDDLRFGKENPSHPIVGVNWDEAMTFAKWLGMRLPTEAEGEFVARGYDPDQNGVYKCREYPWGDVLNLDYVTFNTDETRPVNAHRDGKSFFEVWDLSGNVWEWRYDWYDGKGYNPKDLRNPRGPDNGYFHRVVRGGSWCSGNRGGLRGAGRGGDRSENRDSDVGFRVAEDLK